MIWHRHSRTSTVALVLAAGLASTATAQVLPLEIRQDATRYNLSSTNGLPISSTRGTPPGSDGRGPTVSQQQAAALTTVPATTNQFRSFIAFGAGAKPGSPGNLNPSQSYVANAENLNLPRGKMNNQLLVIMPRARVGAPFLSRSISFLFGQRIPVPETDEYGVLLNTVNANIHPPRPITPPLDYWLAEPHSTVSHTDSGYYWSPHARAVFAINPGPLRIAWRRAAASTIVNPPSGVTNVQVLGIDYVVLTNQYIVSGSPVKPPRQMYWTERSFAATGKPVTVPSARVGGINVVYNNNFPERVANEVVIPGQSSIVTSNALYETRTLWFDETGGGAGGQLRAYNREGRVFVELLGDVRPNSTRDHLDFEIVDVGRQQNPDDVTIELGEPLTAYPGGAPTAAFTAASGEPPGAPPDAALFPEPLSLESYSFIFQTSSSSGPTFYATRETVNRNDLFVQWLEEGAAGLKWAFRLVRYELVWPDDVSKYSHYVRPLVSSRDKAKETAVALPGENAPIIAYQDPPLDPLDPPRGELTETFAYYSWLTPEYPAHRALLRFNSAGNIRFELVFSWLNENLKNHQFEGTLATTLTTWDADTRTFNWTDDSPAPRVVNVTVNVGDRITAPDGEPGGGHDTNYLAGYILQSKGTSFNPVAYADPFTDGFEAANRGAIIPVNAIPRANALEVWWFRKNQVDLAKGFKNSFWPAVIGRYTLQWPATPAEIVLASNHGSGPLLSLQARGSIYVENRRSEPGYNPNEEHALMQGGQAFALRDDLNIITDDPAVYSSHSFVLLSYTEADNRPAMRAFKVLREKPGITFNYIKEAGAILQPPMPLPLLEKPLVDMGAGQPRKSLNTEIGFWEVAASRNFPVATRMILYTEITTVERHYIQPNRPVALQQEEALASSLIWFYPQSVDTTTLLGWLSRKKPLRLSPWTGEQTDPNRLRFAVSGSSEQVASSDMAFLYDPEEGFSWEVTVSTAVFPTFGAADVSSYVEVQFPNPAPERAKNAKVLLVRPPGDLPTSLAGYRMSYEVRHSGISSYSLFTLQDRKANVWIYRGPHNSQDDPSMTMKFYYKTLPGFFFPGHAQPDVGTITPYLRGRNPDGSFEDEDDPVYGNRINPRQGDGQALGITYRPVWPANVPVLQMAETLTTPKRGLPDVRGQSSVEIVYQQSHVPGGLDKNAVVLHDPTREKSVALGRPDNALILTDIPGSVKTHSFQGKTWFPNLPPHLVERFFFDPNRGERGALVFKGAFVDAPVGDKYVLLNVLGTGDATTLKNLCTADDPNRPKWESAIGSLTTRMELFIENPAQPRTYIPSSPVIKGPAELAEVTDDDVAVDSYALTATGPGEGYVSLIAGNGRAFTPEGDPVDVQIIKVVKTLYRGEVNIIESSNPLNEKLTLQQVIDLAGKTEDYRFEWKIASPVDGLPPVVYQNTRQPLLGDGPWSHLRFPLPAETAASVASLASNDPRLSGEVTTSVAPISRIAYTPIAVVDGKFQFTALSQPHGLSVGNRVVMRKNDGTEVFGTVHSSTPILVAVDEGQSVTVVPKNHEEIVELYERAVPNQPHSIVFRTFAKPRKTYSQYWLSLDLDPALEAWVYIDGQLLVKANADQGDTPTTTPPGGLFPLSRVYRLDATALGDSLTHTIVVELFSAALPDRFISFNARLEAFESEDITDQQWLPLDAERYQDGVRAVLGGSADVRSLADNYVIMRYKAARSDHPSYNAEPDKGWSLWTTPQLAEGWIKRVLKGINPFNQRITDLFNNSVNTDVSIVAQAGQRWEGDVALNLDAINDAGLIEIYETVLGRGKMLSIGGGINYGPANDALLLVAGYLNDLYMILGNEAWADAANPTIGIGTKDNTYGSIATALFSFRGQLPSLLEEELALLRGRDDFLLPGVELRPVYNRMVWNYTRGIDAGEVVYALNYNILDQNEDGRVDADDARRLYPQGHGDAYGHYLTALKGYYALLLDNNFDWVPRIEAVTVLGRPVSVDYMDERKFAAAAGALARAGKQIFDLTWRRDYKSGTGNGWSHFSTTRANTTTRSMPTTRYWGLDDWASRTGQGAYLNWVVGNAILPNRDPDPSHEGGIQQIDRTTVQELKELVAVATSLQTAMDNAEAGLTPLGLPDAAISFDLDPTSVANSHFEQIFQRARDTLNNAVVSFDDAKDVTRLMRSEEDSLADFRTMVNQQELAYTNTLIELYGTPYPEDIGPGRTYRTGYPGPDLIHYMYVETLELSTRLLNPQAPYTVRIDTQTFRENWVNDEGISDFNFITKARINGVDSPLLDPNYEADASHSVQFTLDPHGFFKKPGEWTGQRASPGRIQQAISDIIKARNAAHLALYDIDRAKADLDWAIWQFELKKFNHERIHGLEGFILTLEHTVESAKLAYEIYEKFHHVAMEKANAIEEAATAGLPMSFIAGLAAGGDVTFAARAGIKGAAGTVKSVSSWGDALLFSVVEALEFTHEFAEKRLDFENIEPLKFDQELREATSLLREKISGAQNRLPALNQRLHELDDAKRAYQSLLAEGDRLQMERQIFRQRAAAVIQGFRTRDAAFRIFRNEKLERYKSLFDLAAQYAFMAAQAYDYDTGLLGTSQGREFINRIVRSRALGVVADGQPQFAGSNTGDPGLSSALAEMWADWQVLRGRLGFNNPDAYGTTVSLRTEHYRILPGTSGDDNWKNILNQSRKANLLDDPDVRHYCLQIDPGNGLPVPGLLLEFSTTIADGLNLFGRPLAAWDHAFSSSSFATKVFAVGVALEGYQGMDTPPANGGAVEAGGGASPGDPDLAFLDPNAMSATPYVYLIPVGVDSMRSPPLGDASVIRTWSVQDVTIPLPFNIGGSDASFRGLWRSADSLSEPLFGTRKHQAFRPVPSASVFGNAVVYWSGGELERTQWTNTRLLGRSVWNSKWKLIIPGKTLLNNPDEGLERFLRSVHDVKLYFHTYSYSGN